MGYLNFVIGVLHCGLMGEWESYGLYRLLKSKIESGEIGFSILTFISDNPRGRAERDHQEDYH